MVKFLGGYAPAYSPLHICVNTQAQKALFAPVCCDLPSLLGCGGGRPVSAVNQKLKAELTEHVITGKLNELLPVDENLKDNQDFNTFHCG